MRVQVCALLVLGSFTFLLTFLSFPNDYTTIGVRHCYLVKHPQTHIHLVVIYLGNIQYALYKLKKRDTADTLGVVKELRQVMDGVGTKVLPPYLIMMYLLEYTHLVDDVDRYLHLDIGMAAIRALSAYWSVAFPMSYVRDTGKRTGAAQSRHVNTGASGNGGTRVSGRGRTSVAPTAVAVRSRLMPILEHSEARAYFKRFCVDCLCAENVVFWEEVTQLRQQQEQAREEARAQAALALTSAASAEKGSVSDGDLRGPVPLQLPLEAGEPDNPLYSPSFASPSAFTPSQAWGPETPSFRGGPPRDKGEGATTTNKPPSVIREESGSSGVPLKCSRSPEVVERCRDIYARFVAPDAPFLLNLPSQAYSDLHAAADEGLWCARMYEGALSVVVRMMIVDTYPRFKTSSHFHEMQQHLDAIRT